jgi:hypothetical protein
VRSNEEKMMKRNLMTAAVAFAATFAFMTLAGTVSAGPAADADTDGVQDGIDNCRDDANATQIDIDLDGRGNTCDSDWDNANLPTEVVGIPDFGLFVPSFGVGEGDPGYCDVCDMNGDEVVGIPDFGVWLPDFGLTLDPATKRASAPEAPDVNANAGP